MTFYHQRLHCLPIGRLSQHPINEPKSRDQVKTGTSGVTNIRMKWNDEDLSQREASRFPLPDPFLLPFQTLSHLPQTSVLLQVMPALFRIWSGMTFIVQALDPPVVVGGGVLSLLLHGGPVLV